MSFTFTNGCHTARVDGQHAYIPAVGWVRMREALHFTGDILSATVSLTAGRRFIAFQVQTADRKPALRPGPVMGIDMGIKTLATLWDGDEVTEIANPRPLQAALAELRRVHQAHCPLAQGARQAQPQPPAGGPVRGTATPVRPGVAHAQRPPSQGRDRPRPAGRDREGGDPEHLGDGAKQPPGTIRPRRGPGRVPADAGVQVRLARDRVRADGPLVPVLEDLQPLRGQEAGPIVLGAHLPLRGMWPRVRPGRECCPQPPGVPQPHGGQVGRRRRGDP